MKVGVDGLHDLVAVDREELLGEAVERRLPVVLGTLDRTDVVSAIRYIRPDYGLIQSTTHVARDEGGVRTTRTITYEAEAIY